MQRLVDEQTLEQWRELHVLHVLGKLGCYAGPAVSFHPIKAQTAGRYHVNANGRDREFLITGPKFWNTRTETGGGGAVDLTMHLFNLDFKQASPMLRGAPAGAPAHFQDSLTHDGLGLEHSEQYS